MPSRDEPVPTPRCTAILTAARELARSMGHNYVGAEHLFLAIIGDPHAVPTQVLATVADPNGVGARLLDLMGSAGYTSQPRRDAQPPGQDTDEA